MSTFKLVSHFWRDIKFDWKSQSASANLRNGIIRIVGSVISNQHMVTIVDCVVRGASGHI